MLRSRHTTRALKALGQTRSFTTSSAAAAVQIPNKVPGTTRNQATAATAAPYVKSAASRSSLPFPPLQGAVLGRVGVGSFDRNPSPAPEARRISSR